MINWEAIAKATDKDGYPISQETFNNIVSALRDIVDQYDAMPDGELGKGLTNGLFIRGRNALNDLDNVS